MKKPLISIIVPIYMIDRYLGICIESILNQTYENLEIILVDDGSKDRCPEICDLYKEKDARIKVIHKTNGGLVSARKAGLRESNGVYVTYVDGDDWIGPGFIEGLYTAMSASSADMVCAGYTRDLFSKTASFLNNMPSGIYEREQLQVLWQSMISCGHFYRPGITTYVWNKLFKREILQATQNLVDDRISIGEDAAVTYPALLLCTRVVVTDNVAYHYRQREDSMLKQTTRYSAEAQKLKYLYDFMNGWAKEKPQYLNLKSQIQDYILSIAIMRSGGRIPQKQLCTFGGEYIGKEVTVYSAGTFGQQLVNRIGESKLCRLVSWIDDDYWEYRRCCLNVDPVECVVNQQFDFILVATVDSIIAEKIRSRLLDLGISDSKILKVTINGNKDELIDHYLNIEEILNEDAKMKIGGVSHA